MKHAIAGWIFVASLALALAAALALPLDAMLVRALARPASDSWAPWWLLWHGPISQVCLFGPPMAGIAVILLAPRARAQGFAMLLVAPLTALAVRALKGVFARPRPSTEGLLPPHWEPMVQSAGWDSMPSGHAAIAAAAALCMAICGAKRRLLLPPALALYALMAWSRLAVGAHRPSEVLAGGAVAAAAMAAALWVFGLLAPRLSGAVCMGLVLLGLLGLTSLQPLPLVARDPWTDEVQRGIVLEHDALSIALEPIVGPPREWLRSSDPKALALSALGWTAALGVLLALRARRLLGPWILLVAIYALGATAMPVGAPRMVAQGGILVDLHAHADDPVDGARALEVIQARAAERGIDVLAITNHDATPPHPTSLPGMEWSGGRHGEETFLHLVILGGNGAIAAALEVTVPPLEASTPELSRARVATAIERARARGALVIVAHYPHTALAMERQGTLAHLPSIEDLVGMGVDGFEVANRHPSHRAGADRWFAQIAACTAEHGLLRLAVSDDHGWPHHSPLATYLPGDWPVEPGARGRAILEHLRQRRTHHPIALSGTSIRLRVPQALEAPWAAWRYAAALTWPQRWSWALWTIAAIVLLELVQARARRS